MYCMPDGHHKSYIQELRWEVLRQLDSGSTFPCLTRHLSIVPSECSDLTQNRLPEQVLQEAQAEAARLLPVCEIVKLPLHYSW